MLKRKTVIDCLVYALSVSSYTHWFTQNVTTQNYIIQLAGLLPVTFNAGDCPEQTKYHHDSGRRYGLL